ncbi:MAG: hypothetical protein Q4F21_05385 [Lachnospiraceae bacterium]|nr:hypothetical protein [Lachnospiraceae bacterium]
MRYAILIIDIAIVIYAIVKFVQIRRKRRQRGMLLKKSPGEILDLEQAQILPALKQWIEGYYLSDSRVPFEEQLQQMPSIERNIYTALQFNQHVREGGLYKYFVESGRYTIPYVCKALKAVGAGQILTAYKKFLKENSPDLSDVHIFYQDYLKKKKRVLDKAYDYNTFNQKFKELHTIHKKTIAQIASYDNSESAEDVEKDGRQTAGNNQKQQFSQTENLSQLIRDYAKKNLVV